MIKRIWCGSVVALLLAVVAGCGTVASKPASHAKSCPSGTVSTNENGSVHCLEIKSSATNVSSLAATPATVETATYQPNTRWNTSFNQAAQQYMKAVMQYMNKGGYHLFPKGGPLPFPLHWTVGLLNGGGPSGSPIVLWQLVMPSSYTQWKAAEWQDAFNILQTQYLYSGLAESHLGALANSQGNAIDQAFQLVASDYATVRLVSGNTVPSNTVGITTPVPTTMLMWQPNVSTPFSTIWSEWIAPTNQYPQLTGQTESNMTALTQNLKTSGKQIWQKVHQSLMSEPSPSAIPSKAASSTAPPSSVSSSTSSPPSATQLNVAVTPTPLGIQVHWTAATGPTPVKATVSYNESGSTQSLSATIQNGGILPNIAIGDVVSVSSVQSSPTEFGYNFGPSSVEYGTVATQLTEIHPLVDSARIDFLWIQYDRWLPNQTPSQTFADYQVEDITTHTSLPVTASVVNGGQLRLTIIVPLGAVVVSGNTIQVTTITSVVTTSTGQPSVTDVSGIFNG